MGAQAAKVPQEGDHSDGAGGDAGRQRQVNQCGADTGGHEHLAHGIGEHVDEEHHDDATDSLGTELKSVVKAATVYEHTDSYCNKHGDSGGQY